MLMVKRASTSKGKTGKSKSEVNFQKEFEAGLLEEMEKVRQRIVQGDIDVNWRGIIYRNGGKE